MGQCPLVFVSYSREDAEWRRRIEEMLKPLVRRRRLEVWSDQRNEIGYQWRPQLEDAIERSQAALLLVSPSFLASDFIMERELPTLIAYRVRLVPVLVRECLWEEEELLEPLQWAHDPDPEQDGPIADAENPERAITSVCRKLIELLPGQPPMTLEGSDSPPRVAPPLRSAEAIAAGAEVGELDGVPPLPAGFVVREEIDRLRKVLITSPLGAAGITSQPLGLRGEGGIGKTVLASALAHDEQIRRHFPDRVWWVTVGEHPDLLALQINLLHRLGGADPEPRSTVEAAGRLRALLADRRALLVIDDVWSTAAAQAFRVAGPRGRVLYTTRHRAVLEDVDAVAQPIDVLPEDAARELLANLTAGRIWLAQADEVLKQTGRVALAVSLVGAAIAGGQDWAKVIAELDRGRDTFGDHPYANVFKAMQVGISALLDEDAHAYRALAVYPGDTIIPIEAVARLWNHLYNSTDSDTRGRLERLASRELLTLKSGGISFHDLQRAFLLLHTKELSLLHEGLLAAYRTLLPTRESSWARLPEDEPYIWEHLIYHLRRAGDGPGVVALVTDLAYLALRTVRSGRYAAESDLYEAKSLYPDHDGIRWLLALFAQWSRLFTNQPTPGDLAATLASRTRGAPASINVRGLKPLFPTWFFRTLWGLPAASPSLTRVLEGHQGNVVAVAFSPMQQRRLASASSDGTVRLWDSATGELVTTLESNARKVWGVAFSYDGTMLASADDDGTVQLWEATSGQSATLTGHSRRVWEVTFSRDGRLLASASADGTVRLWDLATYQPVMTLYGHVGKVFGLAISPGGSRLASGGDDGTVRLWDPRTGELIAILNGHEGSVWGLAFSLDGTIVASASADGTVRLWDPATNEPVSTLTGHSGPVRGVAFSRDGLLASAGDDGAVRLWDPTTGRHSAALLGHIGWVRGVAFSSDGQQLASAGDDTTVRLWDPATDQPSNPIKGHSGRVRGVAFSCHGQRLASAGDDGTVRLWNPASGEQIATFQGHSGRVYCVALSSDGTLLASAGDDRTVRVWDLASGQSTRTLRGHTDRVWAVAFSLDGQYLASASDDGTLRLWDMATGQALSSLNAHTGSVNGVTFCSDGTMLASACADGTVRLWDPATAQPIARLKGHTDWVRDVAFSPAGTVLASASHDRSVRLWNPATAQPIARLKGHTDWVWGVAFAPTGTMLASASYDGTVRLWDVEERVAISQLKLGVPIAAIVWETCGIVAAAHSGLVRLQVIHGQR